MCCLEILGLIRISLIYCIVYFCDVVLLVIEVCIFAKHACKVFLAVPCYVLFRYTICIDQIYSACLGLEFGDVAVFQVTNSGSYFLSDAIGEQ